ncbi:MAG: transporter, Ompp1/FadL/TodX family protein [Leptospiraceae bacterium]|nr:transporter, Ompp1/FadL/TodX family protein [Leptospiraceae bacterium]
MKKLLLSFFLTTSISIFADAFHNINGFFGERASGMGGAFTAVSDDPSGAFYNPAGLSYAYDNAISLSASNYTTIKKTYKNVIGPGQNYSRNSQNYIPNFFGIVREMGKGKIAFSIVSPVQDSFQRNDTINNPIFYNDVRSLRFYNRENYNQIMTGFSYSRPITKKISLGATLYYFNDQASISNTSLVLNRDKSYSTQTLSDNRVTVGFMPIIGLMFTPTEKLSFGLSLRRTMVTGENRLVNTFALNSSAADSDQIVFVEGTHRALSGNIGNTLYKGAAPTGRIPEVNEVRAGVAFFPNKKLMTSFDIINTSGYSRKQDNTEILFGGGVNPTITLTDKENLELKRYETTNFAAGLEYFLTEYIAIRVGGFTNYANSKKIDWLTSALQARNRSISDTEVISTQGNTTIQYRIPALRDNPRNEYVNNFGFSLGLSFSTSKASIAINYIRETGLGASQVDNTRPSQQLQYNSESFYVVVSSRNN